MGFAFRIRLGQALLGLAGSLVLAASFAPPAVAQQKGAPKHPMALIPFESERAKERGDRALLQLNEDASRIPGHRIVELPIVNGKLGEHARLDDGVEIFFPFGRILTASTEYNKYRVLPGAGDRPAEFMPDPHFNRVKQFDAALGPVCASERDGNSRVELRMGSNNSVSLVRAMPPVETNPADKDAMSYRVVSAMDVRYIARQAPEAERLFRLCQKPVGERVSAKND